MYKQLLSLLSSSALVSICSLLSLSLTIKAIGLEDYSYLMLSFSYVCIISSVFNIQSFDALIKFMPSYEIKGFRSSLINQLFTTDLITALFTVIIGISIYRVLFEYFSWNNKTGELYLILLLQGLFNITGTFDGVYRYYKYFSWISIRNTICSGIILLLNFYGYQTNRSIYYFAYIMVSTSIIRLIFDITYFFIIKEKISYKFDFPKSIYKKVIKFNLITNITKQIDLPVKQFTPIIIASNIPIENVGIYKLLEKLGAIVGVVISILIQYFGSEISKLIHSGKLQTIMHIGNKFTYLFIINSSLLIITFYILSFFFEKYIPSVILNNLNLITIYLIYIAITSSMFYQHTVFIYSGLEKNALIIALITNSLYILLIGLACSKYGLIGVIALQIIQAITIFIIKNFYIKMVISKNETTSNIT